MKVGAQANFPYASHRTESSVAVAASQAGAASFSRVLSTIAPESNAIGQPNFTSMTRKEMFDWMNDQIRSGRMSLDESSPFLGMTMKISAATCQTVEMSTDTTRINFVAKARSGIEGALSRSDKELAMRLQAAMEIMNER